MMQRWSAKNVGPASFDANAQDGSNRADDGVKFGQARLSGDW